MFFSIAWLRTLLNSWRGNCRLSPVLEATLYFRNVKDSSSSLESFQRWTLMVPEQAACHLDMSGWQGKMAWVLAWLKAPWELQRKHINLMMLRLGLSPAPTSQTLCHLLSQAACLMGKEQLEEPYHQACDRSRGMVWRWEFVWYFEFHSDASLMAFLPGWRMWWGWGTEVMSQINERWKGV